MPIDLKTATVESLRQSFDHLVEKLEAGKTPSRYQESVWGLQPKLNFHYRPTWDPRHELYDPGRTAIEMDDFDDLVDPRQFYYGAWTMRRGKQQDSQERNFNLVEDLGLLKDVESVLQDKIRSLVIPLRHVAWAANANNSYIAAYGFGAPITSACAMHMMDHLAIAQYITRIGLILDDNDPAVLDMAKQTWLIDPMWQPLRKLVEDSMVTKDWFELFLVQNFLVDGMLHPLVFGRFLKEAVSRGATAFAMLTEFEVDWYSESSRWIDAVIQRTAVESASNRRLLESWIASWIPRVQAAVLPLSDYTVDASGVAAIDEIIKALSTRAGEAGLQL